MGRVYSYIGDADLNDPKLFQAQRVLVATGQEFLAKLQDWQTHNRCIPSVFTFIVDTDGLLWIADRQSEHIACARGGAVLSAGEMTFDTEDGQIIVSGVTNQSTGYCPEPESWPAVEAALNRVCLPHPSRFMQEFIFRRCETCGQRNIVKENDYHCAVCGSELPQEWNFRSRTETRHDTAKS